ncbi:MAG TPA: DUF488 domain-containing protein [Ktedonobacterales bacterium]|jgi:uncharacterized protein (DUF488 family)|nr:DUF488 domain-containing protein [Ktedonobacterales bacterium]
MGRRKHPLYTIGYSGHTLDSFVATLQAEGVSLLIDVRMTPISRKKGFSKTALRQALEDSGIRYEHMRSLGSPRDLRTSLYENKDYDAFFASYRAYLACQTPSVSEAASFATSERTCLMCVEHEPHQCHRSVVADAIADAMNAKVAVHHLSH